MTKFIYYRIIIIAIFLSQTGLSGSADTSFRLSISEADEVIILILPEYILTKSALMPRLLELNYEQKKIIRPSLVESWKALGAALDATKWTATDKIGDYRWGIHVRAKSHDIAVAYIDRTAGLAIVDGKKLAVSGKLIRWLNKQVE